MRVLFATTAGSGHFGPLIPFARACAAAGHEVRVGAPDSFAAAVIGAGLDHAPFADPPPEIVGPIYARLPDLSFEEANETVMAEIFGRHDAQAARPGLTDLIAAWRPDIVVREPCEFGSLVAAAGADVPQVQVAIGMGGTRGFALPILAEPLVELSVMAGLAEEAALQMLLTTPGFTCVPPTLDNGGAPEPTGAAAASEGGPLWRFRDASMAAGRGSLPAPWGDPAHPLIYVTFGSVTAGLGPFAELYAATLHGLADLPVRVLMTTGDGLDPTTLEPVPVNAHVTRWWPQAEVMPHAAAVVGHGGFGTTMMALAAGVPQVVIPLFAFDQVVNGQRVEAAGAGLQLSGGPDAPAAVPSALNRVLTDPTHRRGAQAVAAEMANLPEVATSVPILEALARG